MIATTLGLATICILVFVSALFVLSLLLKRNDVADVAWGTGILIVGLVSYLSSPDPTLAQLIILVLGALWGVRLTLRIYLRNRKKPEDARYKAWRDQWGATFYVRSYLQVYLLQGLLMIVVGYPFIHAQVFSSNDALGYVSIAGILIWAIGYFFEVVGDYQLDTFLKNPNKPSTIMQTGLWKYSRHPNYFGEITMWWGIWLIISPLPLSMVALISPLTITFLILKVSGIPMLEKNFANNPEFIDYKARTSALIPLFPKK